MPESSPCCVAAEMDIMAALLDAQYGPTSVDEEQEMVVLQARAQYLPHALPHSGMLSVASRALFAKAHRLQWLSHTICQCPRRKAYPEYGVAMM